MAGENLINTGDYSARRYAEFIDSLPAALFRTTIEGQIIYCNHAFADLFGFESARSPSYDVLPQHHYVIFESKKSGKLHGLLIT